jgi:hypothetical protein
MVLILLNLNHFYILFFDNNHNLKNQVQFMVISYSIQIFFTTIFNQFYYMLSLLFLIYLVLDNLYILVVDSYFLYDMVIIFIDNFNLLLLCSFLLVFYILFVRLTCHLICINLLMNVPCFMLFFELMMIMMIL